jgi:hypothetical protein
MDSLANGHSSESKSLSLFTFFRIENVIGLDRNFNITQIKIHESFLKKQVLIVNKNIVSVQDKFVMKELMKPNAENKAGSIIIKYPLHQIYTQS